MKTLLALCALPALLTFTPRVPAADWTAIRGRAEEQYAAGAYELARRTYAEADAATLAAEDQRWLRFRLADCAWRSAAGSENPDTTEIDRAHKSLEEFVAPNETKSASRGEDDRIYALAEESLGDYSWRRRQSNDFGSALIHYRRALEWWAGARDIEAGRRRYIDIVFHLAWPEWGNGGNWWTGSIPVELAENARKIAQTTADRLQATYLVGLVRMNQGDFDGTRRTIACFREVIDAGKSASPFHDDALVSLAGLLNGRGEPRVSEDGSWKMEPDPEAALVLYRRLTAEYAQGESPHWNSAQEWIKNILKVDVGLSTPGAFLPDSEIAYGISWRNVPRVELALHRIDLARDPSFDRNTNGADQWLKRIDLSRAERLATWSYETHDDGKHRAGQAELHLEQRLGPGAYVLVARAGGAEAREIVLVTRTAIVLKADGRRALAWVCDALTSEPIAGAHLRLWEGGYEKNHWEWRAHEAQSAADGTATFDLDIQSAHHMFVGLSSDDRAAFAQCDGPTAVDDVRGTRIYAFADRAAYRPGDEVQWKVVLRTSDGGAWRTPNGKDVQVEITDPRGAKVETKELKLNSFGAAWTRLATNESMALGEYRATFKLRGKRDRWESAGTAVLFRLEEYKLPEFEVHVTPASDDGVARRFVLGDHVEVDVDAMLLAGGPVAGADVEVFVRQRGFAWGWNRPLDVPWLEDERTTPEWYGGDSIVKQEKLAADARGHARIGFDTSSGANADLEFVVEARVTDASRREVSGSARVRVARREYQVDVRTNARLARPGKSVDWLVEARDANGAPIAAHGVLTLSRERWISVWADPLGREHRSDEIDAIKQGLSFPPEPRPGELSWRILRQGWESTDVMRQDLQLDTSGNGRVAYTPARDGSYRAHWTSRDGRGQPIEAEAWLEVCDEHTRDVAGRGEGLEITAEKASFRAGESAPLLVTLPASNRWILVAVEGEKLFSWQVVHVEGSARLITIPITNELVPNVTIGAWSANRGEPLSAETEITVPPVDRILSVEVTPNASESRPGSDGALDVFVRDEHGEPVTAEVALSLVDEAVAMIQQDYAPDPRRAFYGDRKGHTVATQSGFDVRPLRRYVRDAKGELREEVRNYRGPGDSVPGKDESSMRRDLDGRLAYGITSKRNAPSGRAAPAMAAMAEDKAVSSLERNAGDGGAGTQVEVIVRSNFSATALWQPDVVTGPDGRAHVAFHYPDSLTRWKATARVFDADTRVGFGTGIARTNQPLVARLEAPRFFVEGDECVVSGVIDNRSSDELAVEVKLALDGGAQLAGDIKYVPLRPEKKLIPAGESLRADFMVHALREGPLAITLTATSGKFSDAMMRNYRVEPHGVDVEVARSAKLAASELQLILDVPAERRVDSTRFTIDVAPSLAVTMLDALPYLVDYPYGCTEQTLSRFLPAAIVAQTLKARGLSPESAMGRVFGGIETETAAVTHPDRKHGLEALGSATAAGLARLYDFQHADGGWGWWKDGDSDDYMTAYVVWGLSLAKAADIDVKAGVIERAADRLSLELVQHESEPDIAAWMLHALAAVGRKFDTGREQVAFDRLWSQRDALNAYGRSLFALAAQRAGRTSEARALVAALANGVQIDEAPDVSRTISGSAPHDPNAGRTAHWGADRLWWRWSDSPVESTSFALMAILAVEPKSALAEAAAQWLVQNRRGAQWSSTKDTAIAVMALSRWLDATGEIARSVEYELYVNDEMVARRTLSPDDMLQAPARFEIPPAKVKNGANVVRLVKKSGDGPLYVSARANFFSREEPVKARGSQLFVERRYTKLVPRPTLLAGYVYDRVPLEDGGDVGSGERVEVVLTIETKNDLEYLLFEDLKPAGLEAAGLVSGAPISLRELKSGAIERITNGTAGVTDGTEIERFTGRARGAHQELRDRKVALFVDKLPQGVWEVRYDLRAEVPGHIHALPVLGSAMYVPEIRANGSEIRIEVKERAENE